MAAFGIALAAHDCKAATGSLGDQPVNPFLERIRLGDPRELNSPIFIIEAPVLRPAAQGITKEQIRNSGGSQAILDPRLIKMWSPPRSRGRPDIRDHLDIVSEEQVQEDFPGVVRMADRKDGGAIVGGMGQISVLVDQS